MAFVWYLLVRNKPEESKYASESEVAYIRDRSTAGPASTEGKNLGALDKFIRAKKVKLIETRSGVFSSWNVWGDCLAYFLMVSVLYGLLTWIPSYLIREKHFSFMKMGVVASAPWIGGFLGSIVGGWISDKVLLKRRKPTMLFTALFTAFMMVVLIQLPQSVPLTSLALFMTGFLLNVGWPAFTAYPMGLATGSTYPIAIALVNSGGNLGGFLADDRRLAAGSFQGIHVCIYLFRRGSHARLLCDSYPGRACAVTFHCAGGRNNYGPMCDRCR